MFSVYPHAQKRAEGFAQEDREDALQQIAVPLNILNYLFTQKNILCNVSVVCFLRSRKRELV